MSVAWERGRCPSRVQCNVMCACIPGRQQGRGWEVVWVHDPQKGGFVLYRLSTRTDTRAGSPCLLFFTFIFFFLPFPPHKRRTTSYIINRSREAFHLMRPTTHIRLASKRTRK